MKHDVKITIIMICVFVLAQIVGLMGIVLDHDQDPNKFAPDGYESEIDYGAITGNPEQPEVENKNISWIPIMFAILFGTVLALLLIKFKFLKLFKLWFFIGIGTCLKIAIAPFIFVLFKWLTDVTGMNFLGLVLYVTFGIGFFLAGFRLLKYNVYVHNVTEVFLYGGLAILLVGLLNIMSAFILLMAISVYDMYAVWKSKHMIKLAKGQMENKMFSGIMIPYGDDGKVKNHYVKEKKGSPKVEKEAAKKEEKKEGRSAILGGGDIAFPLVFAGAVISDASLLSYFNVDGFKYIAPMGLFLSPLFWMGFLICMGAAVALTCLFFFGKKDRFYPAMPFVTAGCVVGYLLGLGMLMVVV